MRKALIAALTVTVGLTSQAYAQKQKQSVMTMSLTRQYQSTGPITGNPGTWKTKTAKITQKEVIASIGIVLGHTFTSNAKLVVADGDFSGFFANWESFTYDGAFPHQDIEGVEGGPPVGFPNGYHRAVDADGWYNGNVATAGGLEGVWPAGLWQINGEIFIQDGTDGAVCVNVTPFFYTMIQECYDCFYLNSFITDSTFKLGTTDGPPCCQGTITTSGSGTDKYFVTMDFDNTVNNWAIDEYYNQYYDLGVEALDPHDDGLTPNDVPEYQNIDTKVMRWRLHGIVTYKWSLKPYNSGEIPRFLGTATLPAYGHGFVAKVCAMITGTVTIAEKLISGNCCHIDFITELADIPDGTETLLQVNDNFNDLEHWPISDDVYSSYGWSWWYYWQGIDRETFDWDQYEEVLY